MQVQRVVSVTLDADDRVAYGHELSDPLVSPRLLWVPDLIHDCIAVVVKEPQAFEARPEDHLDADLAHRSSRVDRHRLQCPPVPPTVAR